MDDFGRDVHCLAGLPFDAINLDAAVQRVRESAELATPCFISTPNLNFLIAGHKDPSFRDSVVQSNLSLADGMPLIWMARLLGVPLRERVAGSTLFEALGEAENGAINSLSVFFFGGMEGVAARACERLNADSSGLSCAGYFDPGFGSVEDMSRDEILQQINASGADFLVVSLGAAKGQSWIMRNRGRLAVPVVSHLGAVVNFVAGTVSRAPLWMQRTGLEWLWRIKEEPALWRRYWGDGVGFLGLLFARVIPYAVWIKYNKKQLVKSSKVEVSDIGSGLSIRLSGSFHSGNLDELRSAFRRAAGSGEHVNLNLQQVTYIDSGFLGLLLMLNKHLRAADRQLRIEPVPKALKRVFYWSVAEYLLDEN